MRIQRKCVLIFILVCIFIFFSITHSHTVEVRGVTTDTVKIGGMVDMTGPLAETYKPLLQAVKLYIQHVNNRGGIHGRKIIHLLEDDRYSIPMALSAFKKLVFKDRVMALAPGASGLGHTHAIIPLAEKHKMPLMAATNDVRYYNPVRKYIFALLPFYEDQVKLIFEYIYNDLNDKNPKIAIAYPDVGSGKVTLEAVREQVKLHNTQFLSETVIPVMAGDCSSEIINLRRIKPDYVIIHGYVSNTVAFLRTAKRLGFSSTFFVVQYGAVEETVRICGESAMNMIGVNCFASWDDESSGMAELRRITQKYYPGAKFRGRNFMQGWFFSMMVCEGLKAAGRDLDGEAYVNGLEGIKNFDTKGICGIITFGRNDHKSIEYHRIYKADIDKSRLVPITGWRTPEE